MVHNGAGAGDVAEGGGAAVGAAVGEAVGLAVGLAVGAAVAPEQQHEVSMAEQHCDVPSFCEHDDAPPLDLPLDLPLDVPLRRLRVVGAV